MSDTFASLSPQFVPNIASIIGRITMFSGSSQIFDEYERALCYNLQYNLESNPTSRYNDLYTFPVGENLQPANAATNTTVRFPLCYNNYDVMNLRSGFWPL